MVVALAQTASGMGLALTSHSQTIFIISFGIVGAVFFCVYQSWWYAYHRDIMKHKYWSLRLVGYLQTIVLQRFFFLILVICSKLGKYPFVNNPGVSTDDNTVLLQMFDDSFIMAAVAAWLGTEWYLSAETGMLDKPKETQEIISGVKETAAKKQT